MIPVIDNLNHLPWEVRQALEDLEVRIGSGWNKNHRSNGTHTDVVLRHLSIATDGVISPSKITTAVNNFGPVGVALAAVMRMSTDASRNVTGIQAPSPLANKYLDLWNVGSFDLVLVHESSSSLAANRMRCPGGANLTVNADDAVTLWYDLLINRWRVRGV